MKYRMKPVSATLDFVRFLCVATAISGKIANNVINGRLDALVPKLKKLMMN